MKIIIAGCGKIGATITEQLTNEGHDVSIIDTDPEAIQAVTDVCDVMGIVGNAASYSVQKEVGIDDADLMIAVTDSDEINMLSCLIANKAGHCSTIARVRNPQYSREIGFIRDDLGLSMTINPEFLAATEMSRLIRVPSAIKIDTFVRGRVELLEFVLPEGNMLDGLSLIEVRKALKSEILVCGVERDGEVIIPNGQFVLKAGDSVTVCAEPLQSRNFFKEIGVATQKINNVMIVGGGTIGFYLARMLGNMGLHVKIVERSLQRCEELSDELDNAIVIHGDATNENILLEEGLSDCDAFVSLTNIDETNAFLSLYARDRNPSCKVLTKINRVTFGHIISDMDLGIVIHPKFSTSEQIVRYVRGLHNGMGSNVETLHSVLNDKAEALEFVIRDGAQICGGPLAEMPIRDNVLIASIGRGREIIYPNGRTVIQAGDRVVLVTTVHGLNDIDDILE